MCPFFRPRGERSVERRPFRCRGRCRKANQAGPYVALEGQGRWPTMVDETGKEPFCAACKKAKETPWICVTCERANLHRAVCSPRCMRIHESDGRHRKELRSQQAKAIGLDAPPRRRTGNRVQVRIIQRKRPNT